ncbi:hypothetical protein L596_019815 [Steinernema carpocapsae]|uniref:U1 small nuclear ribonucleoprotein C n=1 Tax=Steinernema carpocapsae TaxID=34508 RepID=A0A4U5MRQ9_STECR|nr:hypothetical protein L596_019815 [Steinernema carpocapsae]
MPKYYCDYCDTFLTHDSPSVRKTHNGGRKHKENVRFFYQKFMEQQAQKLVDATTKAFAQGKLHGLPLMPPPMMGPPMMMPPPMMRPGAGTMGPTPHLAKAPFPVPLPFGMMPPPHLGGLNHTPQPFKRPVMPVPAPHVDTPRPLQNPRAPSRFDRA